MDSKETTETTSGRAAGSRSSTLTLMLGVLAPFSALAGTYMANQRIVDPYPGFGGIILGLLLGILTMLMGAIAMFLTRGDRNPSARKRATFGATVAVLYFAALIGLAVPSADRPRINDITTDTKEPPEFVLLARLPENQGRDMKYDPSFAPIQKAGYPTIGPKILDRDPEDAFDLALRAILGLPETTVLISEREEGRIEAFAESGIFRFKDDIIVRIRPHERGARIDIRSKSRDGRGDLGANAARIEAIFLALR